MIAPRVPGEMDVSIHYVGRKGCWCDGLEWRHPAEVQPSATLSEVERLRVRLADMQHQRDYWVNRYQNVVEAERDAAKEEAETWENHYRQIVTESAALKSDEAATVLCP